MPRWRDDPAPVLSILRRYLTHGPEADSERHFRDARASAVMAPTVDALQEFIGRALCGLPLFG